MAAIRENDDKQKKRLMMTTMPIPRLIFKLATPTVISMLVTAIYNIVDTFFVGQIGNGGAVCRLDLQKASGSGENRQHGKNAAETGLIRRPLLTNRC